MKREIIESVPLRYRDKVKELLAHARRVRELKNEVGWGWFSVGRDSHGKQGDYVISSSNKRIPEVIGADAVKKIDAFETKFSVRNDNLAILRTYGTNLYAKYEIIGLFTKDGGCLLEVRLSERGIKAINELERFLREVRE